MNYWILSLPREDMECCIDVGTFGLNRKYILGKVEVGDQLACYVTKEYKLIAFGEVTAPYYLDDTKVFRCEGLFPDRFDFKAKRLKDEIDFVSFIDRLEFIKNLAYWSVHLRNGIVQISEKDWNVLKGAQSSSKDSSRTTGR